MNNKLKVVLITFVNNNYSSLNNTSTDMSFQLHWLQITLEICEKSRTPYFANHHPPEVSHLHYDQNYY